MHIEEFKKESARTLVSMSDGKVIGAEMANVIEGMLSGVMFTADNMDVLKKHLYYDKPHFEEETMEILGINMTNFIVEQQKKAEMGEVAFKNEIALDEDRVQMLHAIIGMFTELGELIDAVMDYILVGDKNTLDVVNISEELADFDWYKAIILRNLNIDEGDSRQRVIDKLRVRYPEKFTAALAADRDLSAERSALEGAS